MLIFNSVVNLVLYNQEKLDFYLGFGFKAEKALGSRNLPPEAPSRNEHGLLFQALSKMEVPPLPKSELEKRAESRRSHP